MTVVYIKIQRLVLLWIKFLNFRLRLCPGYFLSVDLTEDLSIRMQIILSQEKNIQRLKELVQNLREQLVQCRGSNNTIDGISNSPTADAIELERKQILED